MTPCECLLGEICKCLPDAAEGACLAPIVSQQVDIDPDTGQPICGLFAAVNAGCVTETLDTGTFVGNGDLWGNTAASQNTEIEWAATVIEDTFTNDTGCPVECCYEFDLVWQIYQGATVPDAAGSTPNGEDNAVTLIPKATVDLTGVGGGVFPADGPRAQSINYGNPKSWDGQRQWKRGPVLVPDGGSLSVSASVCFNSLGPDGFRPALVRLTGRRICCTPING